jgi:hypothetical protein
MNRDSGSHGALLFPMTWLTLLAAAACSAGSSNVADTPPAVEDAASGTSSSGGGSDDAASVGVDDSGAAPTDATLEIEAAADGGCPSQAAGTVTGIHIKFNVTWPASAASDQGTGPVDIWLKSSLKGETALSGTAQTCGLSLPDVDLNATGAASVCAPGLTCPTKVKIQILNSTWDKITRTFPMTGMQSGWDPGATFDTATTLGLIGLSGSAWASDTKAWPATCNSNCAGPTDYGSFATGDTTDDDGDMNPGVTANPASDSNYTYPPTTISLFSVPPLADQIYLTSRTELAINATRKADCTHATGTAKITLFDNHVIGCHIAKPAAACESGAVSFLDQNRTLYGPDANSRASASTPITGTATLQELPATATCADVRAIQ